MTKAQNDFVKKDKCAAIVKSTKNYNYSDKYHYYSIDYVDFWKEFAREICKLQNLK